MAEVADALDARGAVRTARSSMASSGRTMMSTGPCAGVAKIMRPSALSHEAISPRRSGLASPTKVAIARAAGRV